jgi:hypothetical protein
MKIYYQSKILIAAAVALAFSAPVFAADAAGVSSRADYHQALKSANDNYKSALAACPSAHGPDRSSCRKQARDTKNSAVADARSQYGLTTSSSNPTNPPLIPLKKEPN